MSKHTFLTAPISAQLELTEDCNFKCIYCYNPWRYKRKKRTRSPLRKQEFRKIIDLLGNKGLFGIVFTGGEPFLRKNILYPLIEQTEQYNIDIGINTNLSLLKKSDFRKLKEWGLSLLVSFPSHKKESFNKITNTLSYEVVVKNLERIIECGISVAVNTVVTQLNKNEVYETGEFLYKNFGITAFCATPISVCRNARIHKKIALSNNEILTTLDEMLDLKNEYNLHIDALEPFPLCMFKEEELEKYMPFLERGCTAAKTSVAIGSYGEMRPCIRTDYAYGNIFEVDFEKIWEKMGYWRSLKIIPQECQECKAFTFCNAGCRTHAQSYYSTLNGKDPWMRKKIEDANYIKEIFTKKQALQEGTYLSNRDIRYRKEGEGVYVFYNRGKILISNESCLTLLNQQKVQLSKELFSSEILSFLIKNGFLLKEC